MPVEAKDYPGFYEIPGHSQYVINQSGVVMDRVHGLKATTLNERLKSNGTKVFSDGFRYRYYWNKVTTGPTLS